MCVCVGEVEGQTGLISTARLHLITLPSSTGPARPPPLPQHTHIHRHTDIDTHRHTHNITVTGRSLSLKHHHTTSVITQEIVGEIEKVLAGVAHLHLSLLLFLSFFPPLVSLSLSPCLPLFLSSSSSSSGCGRGV